MFLIWKGDKLCPILPEEVTIGGNILVQEKKAGVKFIAKDPRHLSF
ncbi:hypothetical protein ANHS_567 [Ligilactobacillus ruminis ATCC 25644]|nr:hypothetical protein ANHS_567 [Ligilactobacillus ruminis ATCC 25644]